MTLIFFYQDYTGSEVTVSNLFAAILGDKEAIKGGSGKVVDSGPDDHIFIYYTDHGGPGVLGEFFFFVSYTISMSWLANHSHFPHYLQNLYEYCIHYQSEDYHAY